MNYTYLEITRIPKLLKMIGNYSLEFSNSKMYTFVGCGSSYNLAYTASNVLKNFGIKSNVMTGGKVVAFNYAPKTDVGIFISRTGESTETVKAAEIFKEHGIHTIGITCEKGTSLEKVCSQTFSFDFLHEESIVMTGSFVSILHFLIKKENIDEISSKIIYDSEVILDKINLKGYNHFVFLGFDEEYGISKEGALKIQEMAKQFVEFHEPLEYRHGPISRLTENSLVVINSKDTKYEFQLKKELEKHTKVIYLGKNGDLDIEYNKGLETPLKIIFSQILAYKKAIISGLNPDKPDKLSKSVIL
ncbi:sugar isomerase [Thermosipho melanesiensis]|uniref:Sugar isomerase (SIS) n=2 Tax=Thermosipho melanesiensis TaxID=46541 RepID=A6LKV6_THEM4|nr:SIS domain-containing protein [Thermosipho melanesiensis]ABR30557.1 sugar isomerase (SIS) [Thermosipho melanesiensis BI429]APT73705.1 sugar isomerase [Thermosipho melanesiensis]OOC35644.1 sugar isomerase [Thermosipho melanesiensis]OOC39319.1 sugar isomerase [Thermosipho melanesiensis]OOC39405.1 sugar isomerase [Thermosipho melanesiensis]